MTAEEIYEAYPRRVGRRYAIKCVIKAIKRIKEEQINTGCSLYDRGIGYEHPAAFLLRRVLEFAASPAGKLKKFTPHCSTWMNQERYYDDTAEWHDGQSDSDRKQREEYAKAEKVVSTDAESADQVDEGVGDSVPSRAAEG